jgi:hypothetical protein
MTESKKRGQQAAGIEFHGWVGFGIDRDLFHRYARVGLVTFYVTDVRLHDFLKMMRAARDVLRGQQDQRGHGWRTDTSRFHRDDVEGR